MTAGSLLARAARRSELAREQVECRRATSAPAEARSARRPRGPAGVPARTARPRSVVPDPHGAPRTASHSQRQLARRRPAPPPKAVSARAAAARRAASLGESAASRRAAGRPARGASAAPARRAPRGDRQHPAAGPGQPPGEHRGRQRVQVRRPGEPGVERLEPSGRVQQQRRRLAPRLVMNASCARARSRGPAPGRPAARPRPRPAAPSAASSAPAWILASAAASARSARRPGRASARPPARGTPPPPSARPGRAPGRPSARARPRRPRPRPAWPGPVPRAAVRIELGVGRLGQRPVRLLPGLAGADR